MIKVLTLLAWLAGSTVHAHIEVVDYMPPEAAEKYLEIACGYLGGDCPAVPDVFYVPTRVGLEGYQYRGTPYVFMTDRCMYEAYSDLDKCHAILVHEMVHYVVGMQGRYPDICDNEAIAWAIYNRYVLSIERFSLYNYDWRETYPECQK